MMNNKKLLGKRIKELRKSRNYTQEQLAELVGFDVTTLSGIESGRHFPSLVTLEKIAKIIDTALVTIFDFDHFNSVNDMKTFILHNIDLLSDDDVRFVYKLIRKKYIDYQ